MSGPPGHREFSAAELAFQTKRSADRAEQRTVNLEARLAQAETRLAEQDRTISEFSAAFRQQAETISALTVAVRELQETTGRGVEQVLTGLDARVSGAEKALADRANEIAVHIGDTDAFTTDFERRLSALEAKRRPGRPRGSKNKPKDPVEGAAGTPTAEEA